MSHISKIGKALPKYKHQQKDILKFMLTKTDYTPDEARMLRLMYGLSGIEARYSVLPDFFEDNINNKLFKTNTVPNVEARMKIYGNEALNLAISAIHNAKIEPAEITHLVTISCTGMSAPGLDLQIMKALNLKPSLERTSVNFMGCYAAIHGLKIANAMVKADPNAKVLVVSVELCTLHFQEEKSMDYMTSNLLFADGAACVLVENTGDWEMNSFYSEVFTEAEDSMAWHISSNGFLMTLAQDVPSVVENNIAGFVERAFKKNNEISDTETLFAIHPGGRKILEASQKALNLPKNSLEASFDILKNYGNMSSATLLYILESIFHSQNPYIFMTGFGPGISMESLTLKRNG